MNIYVNGRFRAHRMTGVQRVAHEIVCRLPNTVRLCQPHRKLPGWQGHLWEQTILLRESRNGVLWSPCASGPIAATKHIVTFHDLFALDSPQWYRKSYTAWYRFSMRRLARNAAHIIAVSDYTKRRLIRHFGLLPSKVTVIHNGVDLKLFSAPRDCKSAASSSLNLPPGRYLLCVGSLEPRKNLKRLFAAWKSLVGELPCDVSLVVSGFADRNIYRNAGMGELPHRVVLTGYVQEKHLQGLYAGSLGFVYPSLAEGFGLPPLEAMACGVPVITSRTTALPEVCSSAALYVDPTDIDDLARAIKLLVGDAAIRQRFSNLGRERAALFTWERAAEQTLNVLRSVVDS